MRVLLLALVVMCLNVQHIASWSLTDWVNQLANQFTPITNNGDTNANNDNNGNNDNNQQPLGAVPWRRRRACNYGEINPNCDECGVSFASENARIVGGREAKPHSWPASAYIIFHYKANVELGGQVRRIDKEFICGGVLVDRSTVLTAAHCVQEELTVTYDRQTYTVKVAPNEFFPTMGSMFRVYLGLHNNRGARDGSSISPGRQVEIGRVIKVILYQKN
jgi:hypothetical protein